jgi:ribosome-associated translation inhibitor RaiA
MSIEIRSKDFSVTDSIREHAQRRVGTALRSFGIDSYRTVRRVIVRVGDLNGPRGGEDKFCRIAAEVGHGTLVVEDTDSDLYTAITRAARRFALRASRQLTRTHRSSARTRVSSTDFSHAPGSIRPSLAITDAPAMDIPQRMLSKFMGGN